MVETATAPATAVLYRYQDVRYAAPLDEFDNPCRLGGTVEVELSYFAIEKRTPKGAWVRLCFYNKQTRQLSDWRCTERRFVLLTAHKKFACETKAEAMTSFLARKKRQLQILKSQVCDVERAIDKAERMKVE